MDASRAHKRAMNLRTPSASPSQSPARRRRRRTLGGMTTPSGVSRPMETRMSTPSMPFRTPPRHPTTYRSARSLARVLDGRDRDSASGSGDADANADGDADADADADGDALSIISSDSSTHDGVFDLLGLTSNDGIGFALFATPPSARRDASRTPTRQLRRGLGATPSRSLTSPSHFLCSPFSSSKKPRDAAVIGVRDHNANTSRRRRRARLAFTTLGSKNGEMNGDGQSDGGNETTSEMEPEQSPPTTQTSQSSQQSGSTDSVLQTPVRRKHRAKLIDMTAVVDGGEDDPSAPLGISPWRNHSLDLHTPSPRRRTRPHPGDSKESIASMLHAVEDVLLATDEQMSDDDNDADADSDCVPSALLHDNHNEHEWLFSFSSSFSPLVPGASRDLDSAFLRFSPLTSTTTPDLQRLLPPFGSPSPRRGICKARRGLLSTPQRTPTRNESDQHARSVRMNDPRTPQRNDIEATTTATCFSEAFPHIRASTRSTPGRDERRKIGTSSVMKMRLHMAFDALAPSHAKREMEAINDSIRRNKRTRPKQSSDESESEPDGHENGGLKVQRKLLQTPPIKCEVADTRRSPQPLALSQDSSPPSLLSPPQTQPRGRKTQRQLLCFGEDDEGGSESVGEPRFDSIQMTEQAIKAEPTTSDASALDQTPSTPSRSTAIPTVSLASSVLQENLTPRLNALKLRKTPAPIKPLLATSAKPFVSPPPVASTSLLQPPPPAPAALPPSAFKTPAKQVAAAAPAACAQEATRLFAPPSISTPAAPVATPIISNPPPHAPCNCKKSKCLKLYCECFARGGYCTPACHCVGCCNTHASESIRQQAIAVRLEKNPNAFKPKIETTTMVLQTARGLSTGTTPIRSTALHVGSSDAAFMTPQSRTDIKKMHKHGCHCKKSACLKKYCECFQAGVPCGDNCRCIDCKNQPPSAVKTPATGLLPLKRPTPTALLTTPGNDGIKRRLLATTPETPDDWWASPSPALPAMRQRLKLKIDREMWARDFSSPLDVSPRGERQRAQRLREHLKKRRATGLLRMFDAHHQVTQDKEANSRLGAGKNGSGSAASSGDSSDAALAPVAATPPSVPRYAVSKFSPLSDATRPRDAVTPEQSKQSETKRSMTMTTTQATTSTAHLDASRALPKDTKQCVYVFPLFGDVKPPMPRTASAQILRFLTNADLYNASLVNRLWSRVTMSDQVWDYSTFRRAVPILVPEPARMPMLPANARTDND